MISAILGLGNPGLEYADTRHNIGFEVVDALVSQLKAKELPHSRELSLFSAHYLGERLLLAKPKMFMNLSGLAGQVLLQQNELRPHNMLVLVDDFNLPLGSLRFRANGSGGGHNGLASLIEVLQTEDFPRLRLGIGPVADKIDTAEFVLSPFSKAENEQVRKMIDTAVEAVKFVIEHRFEIAMSKYNRPPAKPEQ